METYFPVSYSTLSPEALAVFIGENYPGGPFHCRLIVRGVGDTYAVEGTSSRFVFRVYRTTHRDLATIQSEMDLLMKLKGSGVSVSYPIADRTGRLIHSFNVQEGIRYGVLFSFAEGKVVNALNEAQLKNLGYEMARFHDVSSSIELSGVTRKFDLNTTLFDPLEKTKDCFRNDPEGYEWLQAMACKVEKKLAETDTSSFSTGYCQFDFLPKNFHFDGDKITLFDFDFLGHGWLINDLMVFWQHLSLDVFFNRITKEDAERSFTVFTSAYREIRSLSDAELNAIPYLFPGFWLFYMHFHSTHDQFYSLIFEPATLKMRTSVIKQLVERNWPST